MPATFHPDPPCIPPHLQSERVVLAALRMLPPEAQVFARVGLLDAETNEDRELDFLVAHPELGLVIVEVKGKGVEPRGDHWVRLSNGREERLSESPGDQLRAQQWSLLRKLQAENFGFVPQITRVLALPYLPLGADQSLGPDLPACRLLTADKLKQPLQALRMAVSGGVPWETWKASDEARNHQVRPDKMAQLLAFLTPTLGAPASLKALLIEEGSLQDARADFLLGHLARNFTRGRFRVQGAPGSGKSLLARQTARLWAAEGRKVLVVAFNRALNYATQLAMDDLARTDAAHITTFHDLAINFLSDHHLLPAETTANAFYDHDLPAALAANLEAFPMRWDALVVDEAQDLEPAWVELLRQLLRHPETDPILLLEDPAQSLYRQHRHDLGQPWRLELSLRQHPALRAAALAAWSECGWTSEPAEDPEGALRILRSGPDTWKRDLAEALTTLHQEGLTPEQILILAPHRPLTLGVKDGQTFGPWQVNTIADWWEDEKAGQVRFGTVHAFKGLEAEVVLYLAPAYRHKDAQRLRYVALSRARHRAFVFERALAEPLREPAPVAPPPKPVEPPRPVVAITSLPASQRSSLLGALKAVKEWPPRRPSGPRQNPTGETPATEEAPAAEAP